MLSCITVRQTDNALIFLRRRLVMQTNSRRLGGWLESLPLERCRPHIKLLRGGSHQFIIDPPGPKVKARAKGRPKAKSKGVRVTGEPLNTDGCVAHQGDSAPLPWSASRRDRPLAERVSGMTDIYIYIHIYYLAMACRMPTRLYMSNRLTVFYVLTLTSLRLRVW